MVDVVKCEMYLPDVYDKDSFFDIFWKAFWGRKELYVTTAKREFTPINSIVGYAIHYEIENGKVFIHVKRKADSKFLTKEHILFPVCNGTQDKEIATIKLFSHFRIL